MQRRGRPRRALIMGFAAVPCRRPRLVALASVVFLGGCAAAAPEPAAESPLVGRIYAVDDGDFMSESALLWSLERADFVLLGERHDHPLHHELQARLVGQLQERWEHPAPVAFEMMTTDQQLAITEHLQAIPADVAGLEDVLDWAESGWPAWAMYEPIVQAAVEAAAQIVAANLPQGEVRAVFDQGHGPLDRALLRRTGLGQPLPEPLAADLRSELDRAHCGDLPPQMVEGMYRVQRARDAIMADRLAALTGAGHGILIAGAGHVRNDRGVPWYLERLRPGARTVSLAFIEVGPTRHEPPADLPYDYVWFTGALERGDPCADEGLERLRSEGEP